METSTKDKLKGGKATDDRELKAEGKAEKNAGKVQQRIDDAKETVAKLKGKLADLTAK